VGGQGGQDVCKMAHFLFRTLTSPSPYPRHI